jgi:hypothetical protein
MGGVALRPARLRAVQSNQEDSLCLKKHHQTALITGATGQDGAYLAELLLKKVMSCAA